MTNEDIARHEDRRAEFEQEWYEDDFEEDHEYKARIENAAAQIEERNPDLENVLSQQRALADNPAVHDQGWRDGVADNILEEILERGHEPVFSQQSLKSIQDREYETRNFIRENFERHDKIAIVLLDRTTGNFSQRLMTAEQADDPKTQALLREVNGRSSDVFISMAALNDNAQGRTKADIKAVRHVFLDLDKAGDNSIKEIMATPGMPVPHHIVESSQGRYHAIWSVNNDFTIAEAEGLMRSLAPVYQADRQATDASRVLRLPGFLDHKHPEQNHYVTDIATVPGSKPEYSPADFPAFEVRQQFAQYTAAPRTSESIGAVPVQILLNRAVAESVGHGRNDRGFWLAVQLRDNGYTEQTAAAVMRDYQQRVAPTNVAGKYESYTEAEAAASLRQAYIRSPREEWKKSHGHGMAI